MSFPAAQELIQELVDALKAIVSRVALVSPYYEQARSALTRAEEYLSRQAE